MTHLLLPEAQAFYKTLEGGVSMHQQTPEALRAWEASISPDYSREGLAKVTDHKIPGPGGDIPFRVYEPVRKPGLPGKLPFLVYLHGGGFMLGNNTTHASTAAGLCSEGGVVVGAVEYRLAPEHPFPAAVEDSWAAVEWAHEHAGDFGADPSQLAVVGESAGGTLSAVMTLMAMEHGKPSLICAQVPICACTDMASTDTPSYHEFSDDILESKTDLEWFFQHYTQGHDPRDPLISPKYAKSHAGLPPALVITAEVDALRDEAEEYAAQLKAAGVKVVLKRYKGHFHNSPVDVSVFPEAAKQTFVEIADFVRSAARPGEE